MIEINLLPGARKAKRSRSTNVDFGAFFSRVGAKVNDPYLIGSIVSVAIAVVALAGLWLYQNRRVANLAERQRAAEQVASQYSVVIADRRAAEAEKDSVVRQINVIKAIDGSRYVWAHILDEVSRALPPYTWLKSMAQTSAVTNLSPEVEAGLSPQDKKTKTKLAATSDSGAVAAGVITFRVVGLTVDIQALTRFMRQLEASPWIEDVQLTKSDLVQVASKDGAKEATEFTLDMKLQKADTAVMRRVPLRIAVR
ncbi:MAG TPA: PilN domain-containing protein [Gemmatimonadaceae bacterium]|nr:PilN domain-containing protein [Gemmatimonadaceae bacterium]